MLRAKISPFEPTHPIQPMPSHQKSALILTNRWDANSLQAGSVDSNMSAKTATSPTLCSSALQGINNWDLNMSPSPIVVPVLSQMLVGYPNVEAAKMLVEGFTTGFRLHCDKPPQMNCTPKNLKSIQLNPQAAAKKISKELALGRFSGPWSKPPIPDLIITPIGLIEKKVKGTYRLIHHLSYPRGASINSGIDKKYSSVKYHSFDAAVQMIQSAGKNSWAAKEDCISAYS